MKRKVDRENRKRSSKSSSTSSEIVLDAEANEVDPAQASFDKELDEVEAYDILPTAFAGIVCARPKSC